MIAFAFDFVFRGGNSLTWIVHSLDPAPALAGLAAAAPVASLNLLPFFLPALLLLRVSFSY